MADMNTALGNLGAIEKAMLNALDQLERYVSASQVGPDGKPSGTSVYMHLPQGFPVEPKMYANAWSPAGLDSASSFSDDGTFVQPTPQPAATGAPAGALVPPPSDPGINTSLADSIQNAFYTAQLVDDMLEVSDQGVACGWPERKVSVEWFTILKGIQPVQGEQPDPKVLAAVEKARDLLYLRDANGNYAGFTPLYNQYQRNYANWKTAISDQAGAYAMAMADPVLGAVWPVQSATYAGKIKQALDNLNGMSRREVEDAINTLATVGETAVKPLVALAQQMYESFTINLGGAVSAEIPWSYINPISWWNYKDQSMGIQKINASNSSFDAQYAHQSSSFATNWWHQQSSTVSGGGGVSLGFAGGSVDASHSDASGASSDHSGQQSQQRYQDRATSSTVTCEFFVATIERPWLLGDIFNIEGWYLVGQKKNAISDGTVTAQVGKLDKLLPMIPKAFVIMRNVKIQANDWGEAGTAFDQAQQNMSSSNDSSSNSVSASVSYFCANAHASYSDQQSGGAFDSNQNDAGGWSFHRDGHGGTLTLTGSQIVGWIGEIQPAAPRMDDPMLPKDDNTKTTGGASG